MLIALPNPIGFGAFQIMFAANFEGRKVHLTSVREN
ncbi:hypothetical protein RRG08_067304 [Elysia crispata]|uniref:Uncharacterized protein n=1 Tax=Elysia crispata TaxID=231223 RepID=A0AAE0ZBU7_9GAST|nr:hypothetical protein RRG08_067304 [Elysia crispata]